jgi:hypothetical protein
MFGAFRRAKALTLAKTMLQQTLEPLTPFDERLVPGWTFDGRTVPGWIYEDPYVLGYLAGMAGFAIKLATKDKLSVEDRGRVAVDAIYAVAGANGRIAVENTLRFASEQNDAYSDGRHQANRVISVAYGLLGPRDDPEIAQAFSEAAATGLPTDLKAGASAHMEMKYFVRYVRSKQRS